MEPVASGGAKKRFSSLARESSIKKKQKTSSTTHEGSFTTERFVIGLTSLKEKNETTEFEL